MTRCLVYNVSRFPFPIQDPSLWDAPVISMSACPLDLYLYHQSFWIVFCSHTFCQSNMAMKNGPFIGHVPMTTSIQFGPAMFDYQRVKQESCIPGPHFPDQLSHSPWSLRSLTVGRGALLRFRSLRAVRDATQRLWLRAMAVTWIRGGQQMLNNCEVIIVYYHPKTIIFK